MMRFCLESISHIFPQRDYFEVFFNIFLNVGFCFVCLLVSIFFFSSCFWLHATDYVEGISVMHALGNSYSCWWRVCTGRRLWGNVIYRRYWTIRLTHIRRNSDMQWIHSYSPVLASYSVKIWNPINVMSIQKVGLPKKQFALFSNATHNDDYCSLFNLNLMVVGVVQTHSLQSLRVNAPCHWGTSHWLLQVTEQVLAQSLVTKPDKCTMLFSDHNSSKHLRNANIKKWNRVCMGSWFA